MGQLGFPGEFPFTRGIQSAMYRSRLWTMRQYAGFGTAAESNARYRYLLSQGVSGLSVAFDLPTQMGYDSDHSLAQGEVGRVGVAIDSIDDMEALFEEEAMRNPALIAELRQHPAPALFAYKTAKSLKTMREAQDGSLEARLRAEIEQKVRAELTQQQRPAVPTDLSGARSAPAQNAVAEESLDSILKR